jgi:hypothetical protein
LKYEAENPYHGKEKEKPRSHKEFQPGGNNTTQVLSSNIERTYLELNLYIQTSLHQYYIYIVTDLFTALSYGARKNRC